MKGLWILAGKVISVTIAQSVGMQGHTSETPTSPVSDHNYSAYNPANFHLQDNNAVEPKGSDTSCRNAIFLTDPSIDRQNLIDTKGARSEGTCEWMEKNEKY